jgi:hypothetical protein
MPETETAFDPPRLVTASVCVGEEIAEYHLYKELKYTYSLRRGGA